MAIYFIIPLKFITFLRMRSSTWITVLVSLFMFQSLWNVAAAFCVHEESIPLNQNYHFGHHSNVLCVSDVQHDYHQVLESIPNTLDLGEDHQDHLPSMNQLILEQRQVSFIQILFSYTVRPEYFWNNDYRSPDLSSQSPPPEISPLMVG